MVKQICDTKECRYPLLSLRLLIHIMTSMDNDGRTHISARHLSKALDVHYDTVTKCLKYLRQIDAIQIDR
ncbi:hypothetical protein [Mucilaginibacter gracilis]|uniref:hypothetical protein n=1 Tax=Mucilaginibacter gracilis TaxID=423350 RepID=UPI0011C3AD62|nr:hypothetical protein [Mucilaginibacter gracilis]